MMKMISLSTAVVGTNILLNATINSLNSELNARVTRTKLVSGGVHIANYGTDYGDTTFSMNIKHITTAQEAVVFAMHESAGDIILSRFDGVFLGSISRIVTRSGTLTITFLVEEKLT